ncbi:MAG: DNA integrity scanning protein DisA nucleotide-binding domain protein [Planctomycetales bacterium]|nr:DNA integrity scanning protein DisA nucleotide-binding domain protein [Planctomycetales bacterium]
MATPIKFSDQLNEFCGIATRLAKHEDAEALLFLLEGSLDWEKLRTATDKMHVVLASDRPQHLAKAENFGFDTVELNIPDSPVYERLTQALLESVADDLLAPGAGVVALYSGFEAGTIDSISVIRLDEHLGRLTVHDLRQLKTKIPIEILKTTVDLAVAIGREGREGKPVGTLFVVGDHRRVLKNCHPLGFDPVRGYSVAERRLGDPKVRESIKEIAQLDGALVVSAEGTVVSACQYISSPAAEISLSKGLGTRHWAAAAISRATSAIAITVSESNGTVRLFQNGEVMLRIEPFRRAMKWKDFEYEPSSD